MRNEELLRQAAETIKNARALCITAGAGMGVDSGLPDFRGTEGFWNAYPPYRHLGLSFAEMANPRWFHQDPAFAWGFYGHRLNLYRSVQPHRGFEILLRWSSQMPLGARIFTSNVDGQFQRAGFKEEQVTEVHGSIHHLQCLNACGIGIFPADGVAIEVDEITFRARSLPTCPKCGGLARPNILMFGDWDWDERRSAAQEANLRQWLAEVEDLVVIELGAGTAVPTVRNFSERLIHTHSAKLIRINKREPQVPKGQIGLAMGALEALECGDMSPL